MKEVYKQFSKIVSDAGLELGITVRDTNVISSTDKDTRQFAQLALETCQDLLSRFPWKVFIGDDPWVKKADGTYSYQLLVDTDTPLFDGRIVTDGTKWRYLFAKGLTYSEVFRAYEKRINDFAFNYNGDKVIDTNNDARSFGI
jgi:hypothetical protein